MAWVIQQVLNIPKTKGIIDAVPPQCTVYR